MKNVFLHAVLIHFISRYLWSTAAAVSFDSSTLTLCLLFCSTLNNTRAECPANHRAESSTQATGQHAGAAALQSQATASCLHFNFNTQLQPTERTQPSQKMKILDFVEREWGRNKTTYSSWCYELWRKYQNEYLHQLLAHLTAAQGACLTRRASAEPLCFISAEDPATSPQVRDTGCGYSADGWFISTH